MTSAELYGIRFGRMIASAAILPMAFYASVGTLEWWQRALFAFVALVLFWVGLCLERPTRGPER